MKTTAEKSSVTVSQTAGKPFFQKAGGEGFFAAVQPKMRVNQPGDKFEQEADKMADKVMRMPAPAAPAKEEKIQKQPDEKLQKAEKQEDKIQKAPQVEEKLSKKEEDKLHRKEEEKLSKKEEDKIQKAPATEEKLQKAPDEKIQPKEEEKLQRRETTAQAGVSADVQGAIRSKATGGQPLSGETRTYMESRFGADFSQVRIHNDAESAKISNQLGAKAFAYQNNIFFGRDQYQPGTGEGKHLLAHELTHTIQQGHATQHSPQVSATATPPPVQRSVMGEILDWLADKANLLPGFRMFTIVLGMNPINMSSVDRSPANILRALIEFIPGASFVTQALDNHGVFTKVASWIDGQIRAFGMVASMFKQALTEFLGTLEVSDLAPWNWGSVWNRAKNIFTAPIARLINFAKGIITDILRFIKDAILKPLAALAKGTDGYDLLCALLGEDPITGEAVPRNADTLIGGFMKLIGQDEIWQNIKKGNAIARAWAWFQGALAGLLAFARSIPGIVISTLQSLTIQDVVTVVGAFRKIGSAFLGLAGRFFSWALGQVISLLEILFSVVAPGVMPYLKKAAGAFQTILRNPIGFVGNLVKAGKMGFQLFAGNILNHLKNALIKWLTGSIKGGAIYIPKSFSLIEIVKFVLSVLGLTWQNIRGKLVKIIPEPVLVVLEKTAGVLVTLVKDGPAAAWEQIKSELEELKGQLISQVTQMVTTEIVKAAVAKLVSMLNPAGAVIQAIIAIYNTISFFVQKISQIAAVVASFIDSIAAIAAGQVAGAAKKVEQAMANTLVVVLGFLAKLVGLGNVPDKIAGIVQKIRKPIDKGLDKIVAWLGNLLKKLGAAVKKAVGGFFAPKPFKVGSEDHQVFSNGQGEPMVASNPKRLANALQDLGGDVGKATRLTKLNNQFKAETDPAKKAKIQADIDKLVEQIIAELIKLKYGEGTKDKMPKAIVSFVPKNNQADAVADFKRQIKMQHETLNGLKVGEWQANRARFIGFGRDEKNDTDATRKSELAKWVASNPKQALNALSAQGLLKAGDKKILNEIDTDPNYPKKEEAIAKLASQIMSSYGSKNLAVLHTVDQVAGGKANQYGDAEGGIFGNSRVNSDIGNQWKTKIKIVDDSVKDVKKEASMDVDLTPR